MNILHQLRTMDWREAGKELFWITAFMAACLAWLVVGA